MAKTFKFTGGDKLAAKLNEIAKQASKEKNLSVGFFEGSAESDGGQPTAYIASINEFGGTIPARTVPAHMATIYRKIDTRTGNFLGGGKFVKRAKSNFATDHLVPEHEIPEITLPARPYFRRMIAEGKSHWGVDLGERLRQFKMSSEKALSAMGVQMSGELQKSIHDRVYKPLAASTIAQKGNDQTLIDSGDMINAVDFEVGE